MYLWSGLCPEPRWGSLQHSPRPLTGGQGALCPLPKNTSPALGLGPWISALRASGVPAQKDMGSMSIKIAAKGSASLKMLKNTAVLCGPHIGGSLMPAVLSQVPSGYCVVSTSISSLSCSLMYLESTPLYASVQPTYRTINTNNTIMGFIERYLRSVQER